MIYHYRLSSQDENKAETPENGDSVSYMLVSLRCITSTTTM